MHVQERSELPLFDEYDEKWSYRCALIQRDPPVPTQCRPARLQEQAMSLAEAIPGVTLSLFRTPQDLEAPTRTCALASGQAV